MFIYQTGGNVSLSEGQTEPVGVVPALRRMVPLGPTGLQTAGLWGCGGVEWPGVLFVKARLLSGPGCVSRAL